MKILLLNIDANLFEFNYKLAKELEKRDHSILFITLSGRYEKLMAKKGILATNLEWQALKMIRKKNEKNQFILSKIRKQISQKLIKELYKSETFLLYKSRNYFQDKVLAYLYLWENYFKKDKPDLIVTVDGGEILQTTCKYVASKKGIPILWTCGLGPIAGTLYWDTTNMYTSWPDVSYLRKKLSKSEINKVKKYINEIIKEKLIHGGKPKKIVSLSKILAYLRFWRYWIFEEKMQDYHNPMPLLKSRFLQLIKKRIFKFYYSKSEENEKYVFCPLHDPDDAQITIRAKQFAYQPGIVKKCAASLPEGYLLYVKEHPHAAGKIPLSWIKELSKVKNIKILNPYLNAHDLMKKAECIIVINSTAGWEALLHGRPVVVLARPFYSRKGATFDVKNRQELRKKIMQALKSKGLNKEKVEKIYRIVNTIFNSVYYCSYYTLKNGVLTFDTSSLNIKKIADSILDKYSKLKI